MKAFEPCEEYDGKKINKIFGDYGRKADVNDLSLELTEKISKHIFMLVLQSVKNCIGDVAAFTNPEHIKHLKRSEV